MVHRWRTEGEQRGEHSDRSNSKTEKKLWGNGRRRWRRMLGKDQRERQCKGGRYGGTRWRKSLGRIAHRGLNDGQGWVDDGDGIVSYEPMRWREGGAKERSSVNPVSCLTNRSLSFTLWLWPGVATRPRADHGMPKTTAGTARCKSSAGHPIRIQNKFYFKRT